MERVQLNLDIESRERHHHRILAVVQGWNHIGWSGLGCGRTWCSSQCWSRPKVRQRTKSS
eukprot:scaffold15973_cov137-Isochrysis_galbana.AAC.9